MNNRSIFYVGDTTNGRPALDRIYAAGSLAGIAGDDASSRKMADGFSVPFFDSTRINDAPSMERLNFLAPDLIVNFNSTVLFSKDLLGVPRHGAINFHPGPLPEYAGLFVNQWAIINGEAEFGAAIVFMDQGIDTGPIIAENRFPIEEKNTGLTLYAKAVREGAILLDNVIEGFLEGGPIVAKPQDLSRRTYYAKNLLQSGDVDFSLPRRDIVNFVRALSYRPFISPTYQPVVSFHGKTVEIISAQASRSAMGTGRKAGTILDIGEKGILVMAGDGPVRLTRCFLDDGPGPASAAARTLKLQPGDRFGT